MTESKWLNFAGLLNSCVHDMHHANCPFKEYRSMDQYQRLEFLIAIDEAEASKMMNSCLCHEQLSPSLSFQQEESRWSMAVAI